MPFERLVSRAFYIRQQNKAGYQVEKWEMTAIEFEILMEIEYQFNGFEKYFQIHQAETFAMIQGFFNENNQ